MPRIIALAALPLFAAASLTTAGSVGPDAFLRTEPYELVTGVDRDAWCDHGDDASVLYDPADLRGAHFALSLTCMYEVPAIPPEIAALIADLEHTPPASEGAEFLIAQASKRAAFQPEHSSLDHHLEAWIQVGDERVALDSAPIDGSYLVLSVPVDEQAVLWVADDGRAQGLDLRTGAQVDRIEAYYDQISLSTVDLPGFDTENIDVYNSRVSGHVGCLTTFGEASRAVWRDDLGWAAEGTVFIEVRSRWCTRFDEVTWELDQEKAVTIDGEAPLSWIATVADDTQWDEITTVFAVPEDTVDITIDFTPYGDLDTEKYGELHLVDRLPSFEWVAKF